MWFGFGDFWNDFFDITDTIICNHRNKTDNRHGRKHTLFGNKAHLNYVFKFQSGKMFIANAEEYKNTRLGMVAEFSLPGDTFFLVHYNGSPDKIILLYISKLYNYKDI